MTLPQDGMEALGFLQLRHTDASFVVEGATPSWFDLVLPGVDPEAPFDIPDSAPFLANFLIDAEELWEGSDGVRVDSGPWVEADEGGREWAFEASALRLDTGCLLVVQRQERKYAEAWGVLQRAREFVLDNEMLERLVGERTTTIRAREEEIALRLVSAAESRHKGTGDHVKRIGTMARALAQALECEPELVADMWLAAAMHDVGKIGIPDGILLKPGELSAHERLIMESHTILGAELLGGSNAPLLQLAAEIAHYHHERWDGSGYPEGLAGEAIPLHSRIVAVVDVYDAMAHEREYRSALTEEEALAHLEQGRGTHFDPRVLDAFMEIQKAL